jgi:hypothetical protein
MGRNSCGRFMEHTGLLLLLLASPAAGLRKVVSAYCDRHTAVGKPLQLGILLQQHLTIMISP